MQRLIARLLLGILLPAGLIARASIVPAQTTREGVQQCLSSLAERTLRDGRDDSMAPRMASALGLPVIGVERYSSKTLRTNPEWTLGEEGYGFSVVTMENQRHLFFLRARNAPVRMWVFRTSLNGEYVQAVEAEPGTGWRTANQPDVRQVFEDALAFWLRAQGCNNEGPAPPPIYGR